MEAQQKIKNLKLDNIQGIDPFLSKTTPKFDENMYAQIQSSKHNSENLSSRKKKKQSKSQPNNQMVNNFSDAPIDLENLNVMMRNQGQQLQGFNSNLMPESEKALKMVL